MQQANRNNRSKVSLPRNGLNYVMIELPCGSLEIGQGFVEG